LRQNRREPSLAEIAEEIESKEEEVEELRALAQRTFLSLDTPVDEEARRPRTLQEMMPSDHPGAEEVMFAHEQRGVIRQGLESLPPRQQEILARRYGLDGQEEMTLAAIGKVLGLSRERVRQLEHDALEQLKRQHTLKALHEEL
jgi:RNA polymerase nonessential primary-like sigma factor